MLKATILQGQELSVSQSSSSSVGSEDLTKGKIDKNLEDLIYSNFIFKDALDKTREKQQSVGQVELQVSLNVSPSIKAEQKDYLKVAQERSANEIDFSRPTGSKTSTNTQPYKLSNLFDPPLSKSPGSSMRTFCSHTQEPKTADSGLRDGIRSSLMNWGGEKNNEENKNILFNKRSPPRKYTNRLRLYIKSAKKMSFDPINPSAIKLIHDKAFGQYGDEDEGRKRRDANRNKPAQFIEIMKRHVDVQRRANRKSILNVLDKVKELRMSLIQRITRFLVHLISFQNLTCCANRLKRLLFPFNPNGNFLLIWDALIIASVCLDLFLLPFTFTFEDDMKDSSTTFDLIDNIQITLYLLNILINLHTSYYNKDRYLVSSHKKIFSHYLLRSFWIDFLSSFPYRFFREREFENGRLIDGTFKIVNILRLLRLLRVFKVFSSSKLLKRIEKNDYFNPLTMGFLNLCKLSLIITCLAHWCACCWYLLGSTNTMNSWIIRANLEGENVDERYVSSLYFTITTMLTVGYGDISPVNLKEKTFAILLMIIGGGMFGYAMSNIAEIIKSLERKDSKMKKKAKAIAIYMQKKGLNQDIQDRINKYVKFAQENEDQNCQEDKDLFSILSTNLKEELSKHINGKYVNESVVFQNILTRGLKDSLPIHLEERIVSPGELIYSKADLNHAFYMVSKGKINLNYENFTQPLVQLTKGSYFGIESFFTSEPRTNQATSVEFSHLIYITRSKFLEILEDYPIDKETYSTIRDKAILYNDYSRLEIQCYICKRLGHKPISCSQIHYVPKKEHIINNYLREQKMFANQFIRREKKRYNVLANLQNLQKQAQKLQEDKGFKGKLPEIIGDEEPADLRRGENANTLKDSSTTLLEVPTFQNVVLEQHSLAKKITIRRNKNGAYACADIVTMTKLLELAKSTSLEAIFVEEEEFEFDRIRNYEIYFPRNNLTKMLKDPGFKARKNLRNLPIGTIYERQNLIERMDNIFSAKERRPGKYSVLSTEFQSITPSIKKEVEKATSFQFQTISVSSDLNIYSKKLQN